MEHCNSVERWLTDVCAPLWSTAPAPKHEWAWRDPDLLASADQFHPVLRKADQPLFSGEVTGVYAWIAGVDVRKIMLIDAEARRGRRGAIVSREPKPHWHCNHCNEDNPG